MISSWPNLNRVRGHCLSWVPHVQAKATIAILHLLNFLVLLPEPSPTFTPPNPMSSNNAKMKEVPTFAALQLVRVTVQVTCHNSGKSLWLDLQANSWHGMVEWQRLSLTLSTRTAAKPQLSMRRKRCKTTSFVKEPESRQKCTSSGLELFKAAFTLWNAHSTQNAVASRNK